MAPLVSVCVPTYNGGAYLAECLESVLAQTHADLEVLVVDDGSADGTVALAEGYARRDARVRVARNARNLGLVGNWNRCAALARGEWVKYAFQDDLLAPTCVERLLAAARSSGRPIAGCAREFRFEPGTADELRARYAESQAMLDRLLPGASSADRFSELVLDHGMYNLLGEPTVVLLRRDVFERFGRFNTHMVYVVDGEYWARVATAAGVVYVPDRLATFRVHGNSASAHNDGVGFARAQLDPLVLRHEYAFSPAYANLRAVCRRERPDRDLVEEFWADAHRILVLEHAADAVAASDAQTRAEVAELFAAYPRLHRVGRQGLPFAVWDLIGRNAGAARVYRACRSLVTRSRRLTGVA